MLAGFFDLSVLFRFRSVRKEFNKHRFNMRVHYLVPNTILPVINAMIKLDWRLIDRLL